MNNKSTNTALNQQNIIAGLALNDNNIEFVGEKDTKTVLWLQNGNAHDFKHLPDNIYNMLLELFLSDDEAVEWLTSNYKSESSDIKRLTEIYTYYMYGQLDCQPDVINGVLQPCENLREAQDCPSLNFKNKYIDIDGVHLSKRDLQILDAIVDDMPDKMIAHQLGIAIGTFDFHKKNLMTKLGVDSKLGLAVKSLNHNIVCH